MTRYDRFVVCDESGNIVARFAVPEGVGILDESEVSYDPRIPSYEVMSEEQYRETFTDEEDDGDEP